jgi:photosystem II stability/assembly factor-like uncharacterized protein
MCEEYIYYSSNLGQTWERKDMTYYDPFFSIIEFFIHDDILFACYHEQGIAYSTDNGDSWIKITDGPERFFADNTDCRIVEMLFIEKSLFVLTNYFGLHSTSDLGKTWISKIPSTSNFFINSILSVGNNIVATGNKGLLISSDGGSIWSEKNNEIFKRSNGLYFVNGISCLVNKGNNIYAAYFGKIYLTTDLGDSWNLIENGKNGSTRYLAISGDTIVGGQGDAGGGVIVSTDLGKTWVKKYQDETNQVAIKGNSIFASSEDNGLLLSTDLGNTWTKKHDYNYIKFISLLDKKEGYDIFFGCSYNLFFSSNYGSTWSSPENSKFQEVFSFTSKGNKLFLGCESVLNSSGLINLFFSSDYGKSWNDMSDGSKGATILSLTIIGDYIYAGTKKSGITRCNLSDFGIAGIEDNIISSNSLNIFPQPVKDKLTFLLNEDIQQNSSLEIFDMMGRTVFTMANINTKEIEINAQFFSTGIYYCRLLNGNKVHTSKFQVIK